MAPSSQSGIIITYSRYYYNLAQPRLPKFYLSLSLSLSTRQAAPGSQASSWDEKTWGFSMTSADCTGRIWLTGLGSLAPSCRQPFLRWENSQMRKRNLEGAWIVNAGRGLTSGPSIPAPLEHWPALPVFFRPAVEKGLNANLLWDEHLPPGDSCLMKFPTHVISILWEWDE